MAVEYEFAEVLPILDAVINDADRDVGALVRSYHEASDTLYVHFYGRGIPTYSAPVHVGDEDPLMLLIDVRNDRAVGIQVEHFLEAFVPAHPRAAQWLVGAEWASAPPRQRDTASSPAPDDPVGRFVDEYAAELAGVAG